MTPEFVPRPKDPGDEAFLEQLNEALATFEESGYQDRPEIYPTVQVVGVPRSGTTLATQLLAAHLDIGYIDNLIAAFWKAPTVGIRLSRKLLHQAALSTYSSVFGRTTAIAEPHEFGYFWRALLGYDDLSDRGEAFAAKIDWQRVRQVLVGMTYAFERPIVFKSFWLGMHVARTLEVLPRTCFLRVRRDPLDNALSLLRMRREIHGDDAKWASMKPREYPRLADEPVAVQLAGQVFFLERMLDRQLADAGPRNVLEVSYGELCAQPGRFIERARAALGELGAVVSARGVPPTSFETRCPSLSAEPEIVAAIRRAIEMFAAEVGSQPEC